MPMNTDPQLATYLSHWGARAVPFSNAADEKLFLTPGVEQALGLLQQTAALRSVMVLSGANGVGKSALVAHWIEHLEPKLFRPIVITQATLTGAGLLTGFALQGVWLLVALGLSAGLWRAGLRHYSAVGG